MPPNKMRIGIFRPGMERPGGTEVFLKEVIKRLSKKHEIVLLTDKFREDIGCEIIELPMIERINFGREWFEVESLSLFASSLINGVFEKIDADVWSTHYVMENILVSNKVDVPNFFRFPGIKRPHLEWRLMKKLSKPSFYVANSEETKERAKKWLNIDCKYVVTPGVDSEKFSPQKEDILDNDYMNILYVGRLDKGKGLPELVKAFKKLNMEAKLWLVGNGSMKKKLEKLSNEYMMVVGEVNHNDLPKWYNSADVFCLPSHHEGFGMVVLEAMACGTSVLCSDISAVKNWAVGEFFKKENIKDLKKKLEYLLNNPSKRKKLSEKGRQVAEKHDWKQKAKQMEKIYREVCEEY